MIKKIKAFFAKPAVKTQLKRAARLFIVALVAALVPLVKGHTLTAKAAVAAVIAAVEVVYHVYLGA